LAMNPHNLSAEQLDRISHQLFDKHGAANVSSVSSEATTNSAPKHNGQSALACAACHREHHGTQADLTAMDNNACQTCHQQHFTSFAGNHPDFGSWPYERRSRIAFNHASHKSKHFAEAKKSFDCSSCHIENATGDVQLLVAYENACASCHDEKIATSLARGLPVFALPTIDSDAVKEAKLDVGPWPDGATGDFDGRLSPMMKLLLAADPAAAKAMTSLGTSFEFLDVDPDDPEQVAAAATVAKAIRSTLVDISQRGPVAVQKRLATVTGQPVTAEQANKLLAGLPADTIRGSIPAWFPGVDAGNADWTNDPSPDHAATSKPPQPATNTRKNYATAQAGPWSRDDATFALRYRPTGHADPMLAAWLNLLVSMPNIEGKPLAAAMLKELSSPTAAGLCASCHSIERSADGQLAINWRPYEGNMARTFTKFSHAPHLLQPQLSDCTSCHTIADSAKTATAYANFNPREFVHDFRPMSKQHCAECHTAKAAGDRCQSCHNYHVEEVRRWGPGTEDTQPESNRIDSALRETRAIQ